MLGEPCFLLAGSNEIGPSIFIIVEKYVPSPIQSARWFRFKKYRRHTLPLTCICYLRKLFWTFQALYLSAGVIWLFIKAGTYPNYSFYVLFTTDDILFTAACTSNLLVYLVQELQLQELMHLAHFSMFRRKRSWRSSYNFIKDNFKENDADAYFVLAPADGLLFLPCCSKAVLNLYTLRASSTTFTSWVSSCRL